MAGAETIHSLGSNLIFEVSTDGGSSYQPHQAPGNVTVRVHNSGPIGPGKTLFDTELLQLDISGGSLSPGVMIRESPTLASSGQTTIRQVSGANMIDSCFDFFTELSLDGGQTWYPSEGPPGHMTMQLPQPTSMRKSTWGSLKIMHP